MTDPDPIIEVDMDFSKVNLNPTNGNIAVSSDTGKNPELFENSNIPSTDSAESDTSFVKKISLSPQNTNKTNREPSQPTAMANEIMGNQIISNVKNNDLQTEESNEFIKPQQDDLRETAIREHIRRAAISIVNSDHTDLHNEDHDDDILEGTTIDAGEGIGNDPSVSGSEDDEVAESPGGSSPKNKQQHDQPRRIRWLMKPTPKDIKQGKEIGLQYRIGVNQLTRELYPEVVSRMQEMQAGLRYKGCQLTIQDVQAIFPDQMQEAAEESGIFSNSEAKEMGIRHMYKEIINGMRADDKARSRSDQERINAAIDSFNRPPVADGSGKWKMQGLKTSLHGHQVC